MAVLHVNVDHIATIRQARKTIEPDPVHIALLCEEAGAVGITVHLREDRRHIQDRDVRILREVVQTKLNLECACTDEMLNIALKIKPDLITLVPEKREEITTEGGLDCVSQLENIKRFTGEVQSKGIQVSLFIDPDERQIQATKTIGAGNIELHTGAYANAKQPSAKDEELNKLESATTFAKAQEIRVHAGHGLNYFNVLPIASIPQIEELNIGHSIISRSTSVGIKQAVSEMRDLLDKALLLKI